MKNPICGSCLCGGVRFEVDPPFLQASHCHCDRCRKHSGTAVCTQARVLKEQFRLLEGEELIKVYGKGEGAVKAFCINCGSSLFGGDWPEGPQVSIRMGAFDERINRRSLGHCRRPSPGIGREAACGLRCRRRAERPVLRGGRRAEHPADPYRWWRDSGGVEESSVCACGVGEE